MSSLSRGALVVLALGVVLAGCNGLNSKAGPGVPPTGTPAPPTAGVDADGARFSLEDYRGRVVMLSFWASFCGPCKALFPHERSLAEHYQGKPFALLGVNLDPTDPRSQKLQKDGSVTWRCFQDEKDAIASAYGVEVIPTVYLIDHKGVVRWMSHGSPDPKEIDREVAALVADAEVGGRGASAP